MRAAPKGREEGTENDRKERERERASLGTCGKRQKELGLGWQTVLLYTHIWRQQTMATDGDISCC